MLWKENIGTLGQIGRELSDNEKTPWPLRTSAVYQRNIWVVTKRKTSEHSAELGARCPIMQNATSITRSWTSGVRPDVHGMSEKYSSHNSDTKSSELDFWSCGEATTSVRCYEIKKKLIWASMYKQMTTKCAVRGGWWWLGAKDFYVPAMPLRSYSDSKNCSNVWLFWLVKHFVKDPCIEIS